MECGLAIFDLDGTLVDSLADIGDAMNRVLAEAGYPTHSYDSYRFFVGNGIRNLVIQSLPESSRTDDIVEKCYSRMLADYGQNYINKTHLYSGISQLLDNLTAKNIKLAMLSNKADAITQKVYKELLSKWSFEVVMGASDSFPRKPDPSSALYITKTVGVTPNVACYVGDSNVDMETARAAGFIAIGATWGFRSKSELIEAGAMYTIDKPIELMALLGQ
ncbi:MAG: HAD family hydrolase [Prevotellaceae bacterium]|jgi:phosphoglycolate phosphatase|nr:HAD family hydrolase [Prevotellaceae bacterium]